MLSDIVTRIFIYVVIYFVTLASVVTVLRLDCAPKVSKKHRIYLVYGLTGGLNGLFLFINKIK